MASLPSGTRLLWEDSAPGGGRLLHHEFSSSQPFDWSGLWEPDRIVLCLNWSGHGRVGGGALFSTKTWGFCYTGKEGKLEARREAADGVHAFITCEWSPAALRRQLGPPATLAAAAHNPWLRPREKAPFAGSVEPMTAAIEALYPALLQPPIPAGGAALWYRGKLFELLAQILFGTKEPEQMFCTRQNRVARSRVEQTVQILQENLTEPPDLESLGSQVGCSPFYLSRLFSREMKMTIPQYVREMRLHKAAELLRAGSHNVTEAAMEVGYSSLSHFSKAFWEKFGCCPGLYPQGARLFSHHRNGV